jgi:hypothetical protein
MNGNPHAYLIIGCGHFGSRAAEKLVKKDPLARIIVIDQNERALQRVSSFPIEAVVSEGRSYLEQFFLEGQKVNYIIPAVPLHLAFEFILSQLKPLGAKRKRIPPISGLPNAMIGKTGDLYTSLSDFLCSEDCPEPARYCTITKQRRQKPLYQILNDLEGTFKSKVIRSRQLGPGIGGFQPKALLNLLEDIERNKKSGQSILVSTASRCHGVTSAFSF